MLILSVFSRIHQWGYLLLGCFLLEFFYYKFISTYYRSVQIFQFFMVLGRLCVYRNLSISSRLSKLLLLVLHSFLWQNNIPLCGYARYCWFIHQLIHIWIAFGLLWIILLWTLIYKFLGGHMFLFLLDISLGA